MVGIDKNILDTVCLKHSENLSEIIFSQIQIIELCFKYLNCFSKTEKENFKIELQKVSGRKNIKVRSVNWFLKNAESISGKRIERKIRSIDKLDNFFKVENRIEGINTEVKNEIRKRSAYFTNVIISDILGGKPNKLEELEEAFRKKFPKNGRSKVNNHINRYLSFLFDYSEFSSKDSIYDWNAYELTKELGVKTCLYCNRNYTLTVSNSGKDIIRPELDHFLPKSINPILSLSFYNLIPSCHTCNSNLKGKKDFALSTHFHPYLSDFDKEKVFFTYLPTNAKAFYGDKRGLKIKLDTSVCENLSIQISSNISLFKLDEIYNEHVDIVEGMLDIQKKTNNKNIQSIFEKILVDTDGNKYFESEKEVYELMIRNYYSSKDFSKKTMAKFERDMAKELGLIQKTI